MAKQVWFITGGIASGKSRLLKIVARYTDCAGFDSDSYAREIRIQKEHQIKKAFGTSNSETLKRIIFDDPKAKKKLESMIIPGVRKRLEEKIAESRADFFFAELSNHNPKYRPKGLTGIVTVTAPVPVRVQRLMERDKIIGEFACQIISAQPNDYARRINSDVHIHNNWDEEALESQIMVFLGTIRCLSK